MTEPHTVRRSGWRPTAARDERGSLIVAIVLVAVVSLLGLAFATRVFGDLKSSTYERNHQTARAQAFAGLSDALFRIEQQGATPASFCVGPATQCTLQSVPNAPGAQYVAQLAPSSQTTFTVTSKGTVNGVGYALKATVQTVPDYQFGAFGVSSLTFNGAGGNINATNSTGTQTYCPTGSATPCPAQLGSDGTITCHGSGSYGTGQVTFGGGTNNCPVPISGAGQYRPAAPSNCPIVANTPPTPCLPQPPPSGGYTCPADASGNVTSLLEPGIYLCTGAALNFNGVRVDYASTANNGQVQIYYFPATSSGNALTLVNGVNQWQDQTKGILGNPADLQVFASGSGMVTATGSVDAILYAPGWDMTINGSAQLTWTGAFIVNQFTMNGNPTLQINYDNRVQVPLLSTWQPSNITSIAPASFVLSFT